MPGSSIHAPPFSRPAVDLEKDMKLDDDVVVGVVGGVVGVVVVVVVVLVLVLVLLFLFSCSCCFAHHHTVALSCF